MCGRFLDLDSREIFPSDIVEVQIIEGIVERIWGVMNRYSNKTVINARSETVNELAMFRYMQPCIIPASGYFEWDKSKNKYLFTPHDKSIIYMGGVCTKERFVIMTADAYTEFTYIHPRMPYIFEKDAINDWLHDKSLIRSDKPYVYEQILKSGGKNG